MGSRRWQCRGGVSGDSASCSGSGRARWSRWWESGVGGCKAGGIGAKGRWEV